jgi:hypothetical protein
MEYPTYSRQKTDFGTPGTPALMDCPVCHKPEEVTHLELLPEEPVSEEMRSASVIEDYDTATRMKDNLPYYVSLPTHMFRKTAGE